MRLDISIESWTSAHKRFEELKQIIDSEGQGSWFSFKADWHLSSHTLVALHQDQIVGGYGVGSSRTLPPTTLPQLWHQQSKPSPKTLYGLCRRPNRTR